MSIASNSERAISLAMLMLLFTFPTYKFQWAIRCNPRTLPISLFIFFANIFIRKLSLMDASILQKGDSVLSKPQNNTVNLFKRVWLIILVKLIYTYI